MKWFGKCKFWFGGRRVVEGWWERRTQQPTLVGADLLSGIEYLCMIDPNTDQ